MEFSSFDVYVKVGMVEAEVYGWIMVSWLNSNQSEQICGLSILLHERSSGSFTPPLVEVEGFGLTRRVEVGGV